MLNTVLIALTSCGISAVKIKFFLLLISVLSYRAVITGLHYEPISWNIISWSFFPRHLTNSNLKFCSNVERKTKLCNLFCVVWCWNDGAHLLNIHCFILPFSLRRDRHSRNYWEQFHSKKMWSHPGRPANKNIENSSVDKVERMQQTGCGIQ